MSINIGHTVNRGIEAVQNAARDFINTITKGPGNIYRALCQWVTSNRFERGVPIIETKTPSLGAWRPPEHQPVESLKMWHASQAQLIQNVPKQNREHPSLESLMANLQGKMGTVASQANATDATNPITLLNKQLLSLQHAANAGKLNAEGEKLVEKTFMQAIQELNRASTDEAKMAAIENVYVAVVQCRKELNIR